MRSLAPRPARVGRSLGVNVVEPGVIKTLGGSTRSSGFVRVAVAQHTGCAIKTDEERVSALG